MIRIVLAALVALASVPITPTLAAAASIPRHCVGCDFANSDLHAQNFEGVSYVGADFSHANLRNANFRDAKLVGVDFKDAELTNADLSNAVLTGVALHGAKLSGAKLSNIRATGVDVRGVGETLTSEQLRGLLGNCTGCNAEGAHLDGRDLSGIHMIGANLRGATAAGARFADADLVGAEFADADLHDADFRNAAICWHNTDVTNGTDHGDDPSCINLLGANVRGANFRGAEICSDGRRARECSAVDAATLRKRSHSQLEGALLPQ